MEALLNPTADSPSIRLDETQQLLAERYRNFAHVLAKPYKKMAPRHADDLEGEALLALVNCARRYDPGRGAKFASFASFRIKGALIDKLRLISRDERLEGSSRCIDAAIDRDHGDVGRIDIEDSIEKVASSVGHLAAQALRRVLIEGETLGVVARELGMSVPTLKLLKRRALNHLARSDFRREWIA